MQGLIPRPRRRYCDGHREPETADVPELPNRPYRAPSMNAPLTLPPVSRAVVMSGARSVTDPDCFIDRDMPLPDVGSRDLVVRVRKLLVRQC